MKTVNGKLCYEDNCVINLEIIKDAFDVCDRTKKAKKQFKEVFEKMGIVVPDESKIIEYPEILLRWFENEYSNIGTDKQD